ncbi:MAG: surface-adhesin E family protein [Desulfobacterales bacterium]
MKRFILILVSFSILITGAYAQSGGRSKQDKNSKRKVPTWQLITFKKNDLAVFFNSRFLTHVDANIIRVWLKEKPISEKAREEERLCISKMLEKMLEKVATDGDRNRIYDDFTNYAETLELREYNCAKKQMRIVEILYYDREGKSIGSIGPIPEASWGNVIPETVGETILNTVCHQD